MNIIKQKEILLVEDDPMMALFEISELEKYDYKVTHVLTGEQAIAAIFNNESAINIILMDINLGSGLDGTETAKLIMKDKDIPLIFLSSHTERKIVEKTENITSYGYVVKNSGITVLDASIKMAFRLHEATQISSSQQKEIGIQKNKLEFNEIRYRRLFESAKDGILILNADSGIIVDVNPFLIEMLGYTKEEFLNKKIWNISPFKNINYAKKLFKELKSKEYIRYTDLPLETFDKKIINVEFVSNVYLVDDEKVIQCNIRDTTVRHQHENLLNNTIDEQDVLLQEIQHRAKNSFAMITSLISLRSNVAKNIETKKSLEELNLRVNSISELYALLYDTKSFYEVNLKIYCNKVIISMLNLSKNIKITKSIENITVSSKQASTIGMIIIELLSNAIKYAFSKKKKGTINIEMKKKKSKIALIIEDNGCGLSKDFNIKKISSLGFRLVNMMVNQLEGSIDFDTKKGTKIMIEFPEEKLSNKVKAVV